MGGAPVTSPDRPRSPDGVPDLGDPALDPPLSIRVHPDDDPRDPQARRVVRGGAGAWVQVTGELATVAMLGWVTTDEVASWPRQHWLVAATVFGHAVHADPRAGQPADQTAAELDGSDVAGTPFRMGERPL